MERMLRPKELAETTGGTFTEADIRAACRRAPEFNKLAHVEKGQKRPHYFIAPSDFAAWVEREKSA